ncbi:MAG: energy-coupling factor transporter ATPase [Lachnospiraceae bacterium]|nr:energy-coupling factor transporter ATPase [Lachnospiraceae bacterium]
MGNIDVKNLIVEFDIFNADNEVVSKKRVIDDISFSVNEGDFVCIIGKNGSGKSTLAKCLNGLIIPTGGDVLIYGMNTKNEEQLIDIRKNIGMAFQNPDNQIVASIVEEDVAFGMENLGFSPEEMDKRIDESLKILGIQELRFAQTSKISGGQKQKVSLAGILCMKSKILVLDEPTSMIDKNGRLDLLNKVYELNKKEKITVILISHYIEEISFADRVIVMNQGKIILDDTPKNVVLKDELLNNAGIELPYITRMAKELKSFGKKLNGNEFSVEELCQFLK